MTTGTPAVEDDTGHELDTETSMHYAGARYYMGALGRWTATDPLADDFPAWSPQAYSYNNPIGFSDPTGMAPDDPYISATTGAYLGDDGANTGQVRLIDEQSFQSIKSTHGMTTSVNATAALRSSSTAIQVNEDQISGEVQSVTDKTRTSGLEHSTVLTLDTETATVEASPGLTGTNQETSIETISATGGGLPIYVNPATGGPVITGEGARLVVGQVHAHPQTQASGKRNTPGVSSQDMVAAQSIGVPVYATDAYRGGVGTPTRAHRANPDGTVSRGIGRTDRFNFGTDALNRSVNHRKQ